jgi:general secretion pathway protein C
MTNGLYTVLLFSTLLARWIINISLAALLGYQIVVLFLASYGYLPATQIMPTSSVASVTSKTIDISNIITAHLFGTMPAAATVEVVNAPDTQLNLKLHGIYYTTDNTNSFAVIAETEGKDRLYRQGATLTGGVVLQEIHRKAVILARHGHYETLKLTGTAPNAIATNSSSSKATNTATITEDEKLTPAQLLGNYQQQLRENPQKLLSLVRLEPVEQEGKFSGFRLSPGRDAALLSRFDLKSGDILVAVNGVDLDSPLKGLSLIEQLGQSSQLNLAILRNGQPLSLSFTIGQ